ncbi:Snaclec crotocetin-1 [Dirofilaria immitis]
MQLLILSIFLLLAKFLFAENTLCIPPSIPAKDSQNVDCCKLPREIFPHKTIYEEFCSVLYFGVMADGPDGRFCRLSSSQKRQSINCDPGWIAFYEGLNQFCYKAFTINSTDKIVDIMSKKDGDPCRKKKETARLVRIPNQNINMFLYVRVLNGAQNLLCDSVDRNTYYYYIGLYRNDFDWRWRSYDEKAYSHLEEQGQQLLDYLNQPRSNHTWPDGTRIFADGWHDVDDITTNVVMSNCGMWRDFNSSLTDFKHNKIHVENQGFICAYHV